MQSNNENNTNINIFISCQRTKLVAEMLQKMDIKSGRVKVVASNPPFNKPEHSEDWKDINMDSVNTPCYGLLIPEALVNLLTNPNLASLNNLQPHLPVKSLGRSIDKFVRDKAVKAAELSFILDHLEIKNIVWREYRVQGEMKSFFLTPAQHLQLFFEAVSSLPLDAYTTFEDHLKWCADHGLPEGWTKCLNYNDVLKVFGVSDGDIKKVLESKLEVVNGTVMPSDKTCQEKYVGWVAKCMAVLKVNGCLTDVVNAVSWLVNNIPGEGDGGDDDHDMTSTPPPAPTPDIQPGNQLVDFKAKSMTVDCSACNNLCTLLPRVKPTSTNTQEIDIVKTIANFDNIISTNAHNKLQKFDLCIMDAEVDDWLTVYILRAINKNMYVKIQVPADVGEDVFKTLKSKVAARPDADFFSFFVDPNSKNKKALTECTMNQLV